MILLLALLLLHLLLLLLHLLLLCSSCCVLRMMIYGIWYTLKTPQKKIALFNKMKRFLLFMGELFYIKRLQLPFSTCHHYRVVIIFFNMEFCHTGYLYEGPLFLPSLASHHSMTAIFQRVITIALLLFIFLHGVLPHWLSLRRSLFFTFTRQSSLNDGHFSTCHHYRVVIIIFLHGVWPRNLRFSPRRYISFTTNGTPITYFPTHSWLE